MPYRTTVVLARLHNRTKHLSAHGSSNGVLRTRYTVQLIVPTSISNQYEYSITVLVPGTSIRETTLVQVLVVQYSAITCISTRYEHDKFGRPKCWSQKVVVLVLVQVPVTGTPPTCTLLKTTVPSAVRYRYKYKYQL
jgi:hypothetical protein